jgi:hypothetical protein
VNSSTAAVLVVVAVGTAGLLNVVATVMLVRSDFESAAQKWARMAIIWGIPLVGAILAIAVSRQSLAGIKPRRSGGNDVGGGMAGMDSGSSREAGHHSGHWSDGGGHGGDGGHHQTSVRTRSVHHA